MIKYLIGLFFVGTSLQCNDVPQKPMPLKNTEKEKNEEAKGKDTRPSKRREAPVLPSPLVNTPNGPSTWSLCWDYQQQSLSPCANPQKEQLFVNIDADLYKKLVQLNDYVYTLSKAQAETQDLLLNNESDKKKKVEKFRSDLAKKMESDLISKLTKGYDAPSEGWDPKMVLEMKKDIENKTKQFSEGLVKEILKLEEEAEKRLISLTEKQKRIEENFVRPNNLSLWTIHGTSGYEMHKKNYSIPEEVLRHDLRGIAVYDAEKNRIIVTLHGSRSGADWEVNMDGTLVPAEETGLKFEGHPQMRVHRGYGIVVHHLFDSLCTAVEGLKQEIDDEKWRTTEIYFTGHSQGAAVAGLTSLYFANKQGKKLFGDNFNNAKDNRIKTYVFSMPRFMAKENVERIEKEYGRYNYVRQNVHGDVVPLVGFSDFQDFEGKVGGVLPLILEQIWSSDNIQAAIEKLQTNPALYAELTLYLLPKLFSMIKAGATDLISKIPLLGKAVGSFPELFLPGGSVLNSQALTWILRFAIGKMDPNTPQTALLKDIISGSTIRESLEKKYSGYGDIGFLAYDQVEIAPDFKQMSINFWTFFLSNISPKDLINPSKLRSKAEQAMIVSFVPMLAPYHYGTTRESEGGAFDPDVVLWKDSQTKTEPKDPNQLLQQGMDWQLSKQLKQVFSSVLNGESLIPQAVSSKG